jgi:hypothetical protein
MAGLKCFPACRATLEMTDFSSIIGSCPSERSMKMIKSKDIVKQIRKATRRKFSAEDKIRIVLRMIRGLSEK